jgi:hypothetical protein
MDHSTKKCPYKAEERNPRRRPRRRDATACRGRPAPPPPTASLVSIRLPVVRASAYVPYEASDVLLVLVLSLHTRHVLRYPPQTT